MKDLTLTNAVNKKKENVKDEGYSEWTRNYWRPMMAITYMIIVLFDFLIAPMFWSFFLLYAGEMLVQWNPITLSGGGIFHVAMGTVIGVASYTRGYEKIEGVRQRRYGGQDFNNYGSGYGGHQSYGNYQGNYGEDCDDDNFFNDDRNHRENKNFSYNDDYNPNR